ncbi:MAG: tetratricopeptide repeat protein [Promethearchaeota archaeon]|jgi:tetratricopeptide (TPR) repeat protein
MPDSFLEELNQSKALMREGKFQEALEITNNLEKKSALAPGDQLTLHILRGKINTLYQRFDEAVKNGKQAYRLSQGMGRDIETITSLILKANCVFLGQFDKALDYVLEAENLINSLTDISPSYLSKQRAHLLFRRAWAYNLKGNFKIALETALECLPLQEKFGTKINIAYNLTLLGDTYSAMGDIDSALDSTMKSIEIFEEIGDKIGLTLSQRVLGVIHYGKGDFDQALKHLKKSYSSKFVSPQTKLDSVMWIGNIYMTRGEFDKALKYYKQGIPFAEKANHYYHYVQFQVSIGSIYVMKRDFDLATNFLKTGLVLAEKMDFTMAITYAYIFLVMINIEKGSQEEAWNYLNQWEELEKTKENTVLPNGYLMTKAYLLKSTAGSRNRAEAERLFKIIVKDDTNPTIKTSSLIYLCEFYLEEVNLYEEIEILDEINPLLIQLLKISEEQRLYGSLAEAKLLQAKVALIQMNFEEAQRLLTQAQRIAELYGIKLIAQKISSEHDNYLEKLSEWKKLKERDALVSERLKLASVDGVLERLQGKRA